VQLAEMIGLRNYPQRDVDIKITFKMDLGSIRLTQLFDASNDSFGMGEKFIQD
jgi:nicotinic acid phosphoribosyltransferase